MHGTVKMINREKGFGFIRADNGEEYFFHKSGLKNGTFESLRESRGGDQGSEVTFEESEGQKGLRAEDIFVESD
jgi:cold shock protein